MEAQHRAIAAPPPQPAAGGVEFELVPALAEAVDQPLAPADVELPDGNRRAPRDRRRLSATRWSASRSRLRPAAQRASSRNRSELRSSTVSVQRSSTRPSIATSISAAGSPRIAEVPRADHHVHRRWPADAPRPGSAAGLVPSPWRAPGRRFPASTTTLRRQTIPAARCDTSPHRSAACRSTPDGSPRSQP